MKRVLFSTLALSFGLSIQAQFTTQISPSHEGGQWFFGVGVGFHSNTMRYSDLDEELFSDHKNLNSGVLQFLHSTILARNGISPCVRNYPSSAVAAGSSISVRICTTKTSTVSITL